MSSLAFLYIMTAVLSVGLGLLLVYFSGLSSKAKLAEMDRMRRKAEELGAVEAGDPDEAIKKIIANEINKVAELAGGKSGLTKSISDSLSSEISKKISGDIKVMNQRYEKIIQEKGKSEEVAWNKYTKALESKEETEAVIRSVAEGLVVVDNKGQVIMMNPAAEKLLGVSRNNKIGRPILEGARKEQLFSMAKASPAGGQKEIELISQEDDTKRVVRASSAIIENEDGQTVGMVSILNDITKQKELDDMKASFVANVSHELRTPLVSIEKSVALILSGTVGAVSAGQEQLLDIAHRNLKRLTLLINDLLDLAKLESAKMKLSVKGQNIDKVIDESVEGLNAWAKTKFVTLNKSVRPGLPEIEIDGDRVVQVLTNLIGNAIKFTPKDGSVTVSASLPEGGLGIEVSVKDTGIGIKKENLPNIFSKFYQVGERVATDISGTGIGLSIAKEIVELHGGRIWVESEKDQGAKFAFTLPLKAK